MFARISTVTQGDKTYRYLQILESYYHQGQSKQRVVANLGRIDLLGDKLDRLVSSLNKYCQNKLAAPDQIACKQALPWGQVLLTRHLWEQLNLDEVLREHCQTTRQQFDVTETAFVLAANRLCEPGSEHGLARWLEHTFVCDRQGHRWQPDWLPAEQITKQQRVKVKHRQLNRWYRTLDVLWAGKKEMEKALYFRVRDLFNVKVDMVFYDLTTTYFYRKSPTGKLRRHGACKDGKPRQVHVLLGVVMANGFPLAHHVFAGNTAEKKTLQDVLLDLDIRFGLRHVMVVSDRGLVSPENLEFFSQTRLHYLLGIPGRRNDEAAAVLPALNDNQWEQIDPGNRVQKVNLSNAATPYFVIDSVERKAYEESMRQRSMARAKEELEKVAKAVSAGRLKDPAKIGARAGRALSRHHGHRYYSWEVSGPGKFRYFEDGKKLAAEMLHEGKYILKTDHREITASEAVTCYKELNTVEQGFRDLKDVIDMRPIRPKKDDRIEAHIFVATLALFLKRLLEYQLASKLPELSGADALAAMQSIGLSELNIDGQVMRLVSGGGRDAKQILSALKIKEINPPDPRKNP